MQANTPTANSSYDSDVAQTVNTFVDSVTDALASVDADEEIIEDVADAGDAVTDAVDKEIREKDEEIEELKEDLDAERDRRSAEIEGCHSRISNVKEDLDGGEADSSGDNPHSDGGETTALERICALPEHVVKDNLTSNQRRARSVARRIREYGKSVPAGVAITSSRIKRVLTAQEDTQIHRQTVSRVADFLERFGDGDVEIKETRGGKTTVVFDEQLVEDVTTVVTGQEESSVTPAVI
jgi:chemotaxis regulatin CheY-phosphate phosphatase CheZ